jgi:hypothetical protein
MATTRNALWPTVTTMRGAAGAGLISAATTVSVAILSVLIARARLEQSGTAALVYPSLLGVIARRTWRLSTAWSLVGVVLAGSIIAASLVTPSSGSAGGIFGLFSALTGYRGARAARRFRSETPAAGPNVDRR